MNARYLSRRLRRFVRAREAVSTLEYAMLVGLMAVAVGAAIVTFSNDVQTAILAIGDGVATVDTTGDGAVAGDATAN